MSGVVVCIAKSLPPGRCEIVRSATMSVGVYNLAGALYAIEDRCSHDDGPLCEGEYDADSGVVVCPRHGARFDIRSGRPLTLPAFEPVATFPVSIRDGQVVVDLDSPLVAS